MSYKSIWDFGREGKANYSVHNIGEYPTKIRPLVFHKIVERFSNIQDTVLDSFVGCGTLPIEAKLQGRNSISYDINPNAIELSKLKLEKLSLNEMIKAQTELIGELKRERNKLVSNPTLTQPIKKIETNNKTRVLQIDKEIKRYSAFIEDIKNQTENIINTTHKIEIGDARHLPLTDCSIDCVVTDIPYADMVKYSNLKDDLSNIETYKSFLQELTKSFAEMIRVLKKGKYIIIFVADNRKGALRQIIPLHSDVIQYFIEQGLTLFDLFVWRYYRSGSFRPFGAKPFQSMQIHTYILVFYKPIGKEIYQKNKSNIYRTKLAEKIKNNNR